MLQRRLTFWENGIKKYIKRKRKDIYDQRYQDISDQIQASANTSATPAISSASISSTSTFSQLAVTILSSICHETNSLFLFISKAIAAYFRIC